MCVTTFSQIIMRGSRCDTQTKNESLRITEIMEVGLPLFWLWTLCSQFLYAWTESHDPNLEQRVCVCIYTLYAQMLQLCPILCDPMNWNLPGSSVHGILKARILEWVAMPSSMGSSWPKDRTCLSHGHQCHLGHYIYKYI